MTEAAAGDELLTVGEVSALLRKPEGTLRYWRSIDQGPKSFKIGSTVLYRTSEVNAYLAREEEATSRGGAA